MNVHNNDTNANEINISDAEWLELSRCYRCNCATYPVCTWLGEPCNECFSALEFQHLAPAEPGCFSTPPHSAASPPPRGLTHTRIEEVGTSGNGDCLYDCVAKALNHYIPLQRVATQHISIGDLRQFVSRRQTPATFDAYKVAAVGDADGSYECLSKVKTLRGFKNCIQHCGSDVGAQKCLWGDENTLNIISSAFRLRFAVFDERGALLQSVNGEGAAAPKHTVLLRLNRSVDGEEHFSLLTFNRQTVLQSGEWAWLKKTLKLSSE